MSRYDGLIIPRSYSEYINKTDAATLQQALQLFGVLSGAVAAGDNKAVKSSAVNAALSEYINKTDAATLQQALQLPGVLSGAVAAGDNKAVKSDAVATALVNNVVCIDFEGTTESTGLLDLGDLGNYIPLITKNYAYITTFFNATWGGYHPYARITYYDGTPVANEKVSFKLWLLPFSNQ